MKRKVARYLMISSVALCVASFFSLIAFTQHFVNEPTAPDPASNKIIAWNNHGTVHYITPEDDAIKRGIIISFGVMFISGVIFGAIERKGN